MKIQAHVKTALRNLTASPLRTFLAMLGIMVGTASVVALVSSGQLATEQALAQFKGLGANLMNLSFSAKGQEVKNIRLDVLMAMQSSIRGVRKIAPFTTILATGSYRQKIIDPVNIIATTEDLADIVGITLEKGRFINVLDKNQQFCVTGKTIADKLDSFNLIGLHFKLGQGIFSIIGVANQWSENNILGQDINNSVIIPIGTAEQISNSPQPVNSAILLLSEQADIDEVKQAITDYFDKNITGYRLNFTSGKEILNRMAKQQAIFSLLLGLIGGIALLVGGIGVMNIMLASVTDRHSEIGLRIALGAKPRDVQLMFLMEALTLSVLGGSFGVILGILATLLVAWFSSWPFLILFWPPFIGFLVSMLVSLFFGFYPALLASRLNPIDALRSA